MKNPNATVRTRARFADMGEYEQEHEQKQVEAPHHRDPNFEAGEVPKLQKMMSVDSGQNMGLANIPESHGPAVVQSPSRTGGFQSTGNGGRPSMLKTPASRWKSSPALNSTGSPGGTRTMLHNRPNPTTGASSSSVFLHRQVTKHSVDET